MELTPEIEEIFKTAQKQIASIELTYKNGGKVLGTIRKVRLSPQRLSPQRLSPQRLSPLRLVIQKSFPEKGERPKHKVVFDHVTHMKLSFNDGSEKVFQ
jgi:hypothetical protein